MLFYRMSRVYDKVEMHCDSVAPFTLKTYKFANTNAKSLWKRMSIIDRNLFPFDTKNFDWEKYTDTCVYAFRSLLLKEQPDSIPQGRRRLKILKAIHYGFTTVIVVLLVYIVVLLF